MNIFALLKNEKTKRISISQEIQKQLDHYLKNSIDQYLKKEGIKFDGQYKPEDGQVLLISDYKVNYIDKLVIDSEILLENDIDNIKCIIFLYDKSKIGFQVFDNRKIINPAKFSLIFDSQTFSKLNKKGITISSTIDAFFDNNQLLFTSYHNASRVFDLSKYYRDANDSEIKNLKNSGIIVFPEDINNLFDSIMRKKIFLIQKNNVVEAIKSNFEKVSLYAQSTGMAEYFKDGIIYFPSDKKKLKTLISFLNDDLYKSPITNLLYETNSKKTVK